MAEEFIERRIITGLIVSDRFATEIEPVLTIQDLASVTARRIAGWCLEYTKKYHKAPNKDIEGIFEEQKALGLPKDQEEYIGGILSGLSEEYEREQFNSDYLLDQTKSYLKRRRLLALSESIKHSADSKDLEEAEEAISGYLSHKVTDSESKTVDPFSSPDLIRKAFTYSSEPIVVFPKALGKFWNSQMTRDSLISLVGPEKRGKTFMLMEIAMTAMASGCNVAFFQAGDMTEAQQLRRMGIYLTRRSDKEKYCEERYMPVVDCWLNQTDDCHQSCRECSCGLFPQNTKQEDVTYEDLVKAIELNKGYKACRNCEFMYVAEKGAVALEKVPAVKVLTWKDAEKKMAKWQSRSKGRFKLSTYPNDTLTVGEIWSLLDGWERSEGFVCDVVVVDYADILAPESGMSKQDFRQQTNKTWQKLRRLSQEKHCLVVTATQAASTSYTKTTITLKDFSEDKRKYSHVTAMYSLNQTPQEKKLGIMRLGEMVVRDDEFSANHQVKILQCLQRGRPVVGSF